MSASIELREQVRARYARAGFTGVSVEFTHEAADGMHAAIIRATKPAH